MRRRAFCVGQAKAGTASLVGLLSANYRAAHEPERAETLALILRHTWLQSLTGHLVRRGVPGDVQEFLRWWFRPERHPHGRHDRALADLGLFSVAAYLHAWNRHVDTCIGSIPADRRLVLRTHELGSSHERLAAFLRVPVSSLDRAGGHLNRGTWPERIESVVDPSYIDEMVHSICGANMARHFPEIGTTRDVSNLWSDESA